MHNQKTIAASPPFERMLAASRLWLNSATAALHLGGQLHTRVYLVCGVVWWVVYFCVRAANNNADKCYL